MVFEIEKLGIEKTCDQDGCENKAVVLLNYKNIFSHKFCLCKDCLNKVYKNFGKFITPKSPKNRLKQMEKDYE